ncbi:DUF349 domain-containing protein, partial [Alteromonas sp. 14N.309.X.WAT.G.H12]|uniref:DUF349 domain-containing protein n=1 Tax=Alteromonas sp. 14N.309.X.WAT.G.H12 TaxID=3120824 RepID=UPI002FD07E00
WYGANREQKQAIIKQVKALLAADDIEDKAAQAKQLQQTWKEIGNAGRRYETKLWQVFKETNDQLFQALKNQRQVEQQQDDDIVSALIAELDAIQINDEGNDEDAHMMIASVTEKMQSLPKAKRLLLEKRIAKLRLAMDNRTENRQFAQKKQQLSVLQQAVMEWADNSDVTALVCFDALGKNYKQAMTSAEQDLTRSRPWYTTMLEILVALPSPQEDEALRREIQLVMLSDKLARGEEARLEQALSAWLTYGQPSTADAQRFHAILDKVIAQPALLAALN